MGRTYRGARKQFGTKKTRDHKSRSKWSAKNGTRLRTLNFDLEDFRAHPDSSGVSLHRAPTQALNATSSSTLSIPPPAPIVVPAPMQELRVVKRETKSTVADQQVSAKATLKPGRLAILNSLPTEVLEARKAHAGRQVAHLHRVLMLLVQEQHEPNSAFKKAISTFRARQRFWDTQAGAIGPILAARRNHGSQ